MESKVLFQKILPPTIDNKFPGHIVAQIVFLVITIITLIRSLLHMFLPDGGAESIASIDVDVAGGDTIIGMFYLWGLSQLLFGIFYVIVYVRYKSLIPLMFLFLTTEYLFRMILGFYKPIETMETAPGEIGNFIFVPVCIICFVLSIWKPKSS